MPFSQHRLLRVIKMMKEIPVDDLDEGGSSKQQQAEQLRPVDKDLSANPTPFNAAAPAADDPLPSLSLIPLPAGWTKHTDKQNRTYFFEKASGKSSWTRPT